MKKLKVKSLYNNWHAKHRNEPLDVKEFLQDLGEVFRKHNVKGIDNGFMKHENGEFILQGSTIDLDESEIKTSLIKFGDLPL